MIVSAISQNWLTCFLLLDHNCRALTGDCLLGRGICHIPSLLLSQPQPHAAMDLH